MLFAGCMVFERRREVFGREGTDLHLTEPGRYLVTLVFYASMFQKIPKALAYTGTGVSAALAAKLQSFLPLAPFVRKGVSVGRRKRGPSRLRSHAALIGWHAECVRS
ncbi:MAG TPA: hypothetical protein VJT73_21750 [Polyangiaceae bacterium]|nr:hypothetical protein [Polyangiaceae bacterium]